MNFVYACTIIYIKGWWCYVSIHVFVCVEEQLIYIYIYGSNNYLKHASVLIHNCSNIHLHDLLIDLPTCFVLLVYYSIQLIIMFTVFLNINKIKDHSIT